MRRAGEGSISNCIASALCNLILDHLEAILRPFYAHTPIMPTLPCALIPPVLYVRRPSRKPFVEALPYDANMCLQTFVVGITRFPHELGWPVMRRRRSR